MTRIEVEPHARLVEPWVQEHRGGPSADRLLSQVLVWIPPRIVGMDVVVPAATTAAMETALRQVAALDETHGGHLAPLATLLLRAESVASSKIERIEASVDDFARALHGSKANESATSMVASTRALDALIRSVDGGRDIEVDAVLRAHGLLMAEDRYEQGYAGRWRDMQNWIGGSDYSPRGALYVPPPPRTVPDYMADLVAFANRDDVPVLVQAAVVHAQFESIHPFTDGNGRIGRALINTVLRRRGATERTVVPLASALVARRDAYFDALTAYRTGDLGPLVEAFTTSTAIAAVEARTTAGVLARLPDRWRQVAGAPRQGSVAARILEGLMGHPVFSAEEAEERIGGATSSVYAGIDRLRETGIIRPLTSRVRNQVWVAADIADELDDLAVRIAARARDASPAALHERARQLADRVRRLSAIDDDEQTPGYGLPGPGESPSLHGRTR